MSVTISRWMILWPEGVVLRAERALNRVAKGDIPAPGQTVVHTQTKTIGIVESIGESSAESIRGPMVRVRSRFHAEWDPRGWTWGIQIWPTDRIRTLQDS
jgi:hypothetical protein